MAPPVSPAIAKVRFSRRDFLKLSALSAMGALIPPGWSIHDFLDREAGQMLTFTGNKPEQIAENEGRVISSRVVIRSKPSADASVVSEYFQDMLLPISEVTLGPVGESHNRVWYRIGNQGYTHSGDIQPVRTELQIPNPDIPPVGRLAEVTVPYTDAHRGPGREYPVAYRYYYETTHWVIALEMNAQQEFWYRIMDDKRDNIFFCPASHLRLIPPEEVTPLSPDVHSIGKRLEVRLADQVLIAYEWEQPVFISRVATGAKFSNGNYSTPTGRHLTFHKRPSRHMAAGNLAFNGYDLPGVPWICYINERGVAIHGTYWHNNYGRPRSHGCINLSSKAAKWVYRWTLPSVPFAEQRLYEDEGTPVDVIGDEPV